MKSQLGDGRTRGSKEPRAVPAPDANAELARSMQVVICGLIITILQIFPSNSQDLVSCLGFCHELGSSSIHAFLSKLLKAELTM